MKWRSPWIWGSLFVVCLGVLTMRPLSVEKQELKQELRLEKKYIPKDFRNIPMAPPPPLPAPKTDYMDIVLKLGSLSGALMTCISLVERVVKLFRRKHEDIHT